MPAFFKGSASWSSGDMDLGLLAHIKMPWTSPENVKTQNSHGNIKFSGIPNAFNHNYYYSIVLLCSILNPQSICTRSTKYCISKIADPPSFYIITTMSEEARLTEHKVTQSL